ncbi:MULTISPECIES: ABC transporter permease [Mycobacterium]|uniref:Daunorubicin-DIM-transport integral membrane protein ABC transporter DrrB n=4 Tax=Mycobacteriaceae TaxID=1762 RepID=B2HIM5_MYCMM|nr:MULTISPECIES: ABC transporter permease [Mycobacterium]ULL10174.1 antibiotic ABC transporter permease [Mycobacterium liflandii]ACC40219.1 daunorubicin-DIM-transport integral membrane protein ABC transporter DrrB [Mycobacterium marinum M]AGC61836.1 daunorubicin-DIM-transport integral membrane protein ABC transporter DrrB [Mycobacterium liflandii 128FXT]EPQ46421.1 integral membrane protein [Mycobacterium sp. 012931]EPQ75529.1 daunorubicin-DIM-transport integral membrane protein ABC transporter
MSISAVDPTPVPTFKGAGPSAAKPRLSTLQQWWVLVGRFTKPRLRDPELITMVGAPVVFTVGFYIPFAIPWNHYVGGGASGVASSLGQYIAPLIVLQSISFAAISSAFRAATDSLQGINRRFRYMPIAPLTPVVARVTAAIYRCCVGLTVALICGYAIGFHFNRGPLYIVGYCLLAIAIGAVLSFGADLLGTGTKNPDAMLPLLSLPILIFGLLSVGLMPLKLFPHWIHPFVRNQPITQFVVALRALAGDTTKAAIPVTWTVMTPTLAWLAGFALFLVPVSIIVLSRRP